MNLELIKKSYLFRNASEEDIEAVGHIAERQEFLGGDVVHMPSSPTEAFYFVESGTVEGFAPDKDLPLITFGPGQSFGELPFFHGEVRAITARAKEMTHVIRVPFDKLRKLLDERPVFAALFYRNAASYYALMMKRLSAELDRPFF